VLAVLLVLVWIGNWIPDSPSRLRAQAETAARAGDWGAALRAWRALNATGAARGTTHLGEARACLALSRAAQAERSLRRGIAADPADPEPWRLLLQLVRVEDRTLEAQRLGWEAYAQVPVEARRVLLGELTQALLADLPDDLVRTTLKRWVEADPADIDAQVALLQRIAVQPRATDPDRASRLAALEALVASHPEDQGAREALVNALADAGQPDRGRAVLDAWPGPESDRDARYWRLRGRWELEFDRRPERAAVALQKALVPLPQDWRSWYRLARAWRILGCDAPARQAAETVARIREVLEPMALGPRLLADLDRLDDADSLRDLAQLCQSAGLTRLADAWRTEARLAAGRAQPRPSGNP
jgi:predicted Zn-dependent protease